jgi:dTDP-4-dehydrorhamnose reductase
VDEIEPDVIVNAAAYTAVDQAEDNPDLAYQVNAGAVESLATAAAKSGAWLLHYSTDYVFDGAGISAYRETDATNPLSIYGASKLAGENAIRASGARHLILRTSWVYGTRRSNFLRAILDRAQKHRGLRVVADQVGAPTGAELIADVTAHIIARMLRDPEETAEAQGLYHLAASGFATRFECAQQILREARACGVLLQSGLEDLAPIATQELNAKAKRPLNSRLATEKLANTFGICLPSWQEGVNRAVRELVGRGLEC